VPKRVSTLADLTPDERNANRGTERGRQMLETSLRKYGAGRSVLADKHGALIAGNKTVEVAAELGIPIRTIETDGHELVVVQRTDLDLGEGGAARELAYADNRVGQVSLEWELAQIGADVAAGVDLAGLWSEQELVNLLAAERAEPFDPNAEWQGMPAFEQDDQMPVKQVIVNFAHADDVERFARLVEQNVTMSTKSVWYPAQRPQARIGEAYQAVQE
jgi:hypothetical protein